MTIANRDLRAHTIRMPATRLGFLTYGLDRPGGGIARYSVELARALTTFQDELAVTLLTPFSGSPAGLDELYPSVELWGRLLPALMAAGPPQIAALARRHRLRVVHDPFGISPFLIPRRVAPFARVVTIHDMVSFVYPDTHTRLTNLLFHHYIPRTLPFVDRIVTPSETSKRDILRFYGVPEGLIKVIPHGVPSHFAPVSHATVLEILRRYEIPQPYLLTVGDFHPRKNLRTLLRAYRVLRSHGLPHRLVIAGRKAWNSPGTTKELQEFGLENDIILPGYVAEGDLPALYSGASVFVFPSLYEGFGLPALESMACGTPVVASTGSSLPEVIGEAGLAVHPTDVRGFAEALERLLTDEGLHRRYHELGRQRARQFTWRRAAAAHVEVYRSLADTESSRYRGAIGVTMG